MQMMQIIMTCPICRRVYTDKTMYRFSFIKIFVLFILMAALFSCSSSKKSSKPRNFDTLYDPKSLSIFPEVLLLSKDTDSSEIRIRIKQEELLFNQSNAENKLLAQVNIKYDLYTSENYEHSSASGNYNYSIEKLQKTDYQSFAFSVPAGQNNAYFIEITITDLNRNTERLLFKSINRTKPINQQDFAIYDKNTNQLYFYPFIKSGQSFSVKHYKNNFDSLYVSFYRSDFSIPLPPARIENLTDSFVLADSSFVFYPDSADFSCFETEGIYFFSPVKNQKEGFSLFNFGFGYPDVITPCQLFEPLQYLAQVGKCVNDSADGRNIKLAVDNFWLAKAKNINRSRELIKIFYSRVKYANIFFTSYKPGWQTERGMIYIIYGPPDNLFKSEKEERWIYQPKDLGPGVIFNFEQIEHPFSTNHYILNRAKQKITGWDDAVKLWNSGEVYYYQP